eukprot:12771816-Alexandrium_andersonii.AAC.1
MDLMQGWAKRNIQNWQPVERTPSEAPGTRDTGESGGAVEVEGEGKRKRDAVEEEIPAGEAERAEGSVGVENAG